MNLASFFQVAGGSVAGRDHVRAGKNSHDAYHFEFGETALVAVVSDGCGSGDHSEVGAKLAARLLVRQTLRWYAECPGDFMEATVSRGFAKVVRSVLAEIELIADSMSGRFSEIVGNYFLFTTLGILVTKQHAFIFRAGDGLVSINGESLQFVSKNNEPDYLSYALVESDKKPKGLEVIHLRTNDLNSVLLATDGAVELAKAENKRIPGLEKEIGHLSQFWTEDKYFANPFAIRHRLNLVNRSSTRIDYEKRAVHEEHGPLADDTTIVVVRRSPDA